MSTQLKIWKQLFTNQLPLSCHRSSIVISLLPSLPFYAKPHIKLANFFSQMAAASTTPPDRVVATDFLISKCGLTDEDIIKAFRHCNGLLHVKSTQNMEEVLALLKGCGLTTPAQIRRVVFCNPRLLFLRSERNVKPKLSFLSTFIKEEDISKLVIKDAHIFCYRKDKLKSATLLLMSLGFEDKALSHLIAMNPRLLNISEENVMELFKQVENLGFKKGSKSFADAVRVLLGQSKETLERKLQCLRSLGFSEKQISKLSRQPRILALSVEKLKSNVDFVVNSIGLLLADIVMYPSLILSSVEKSIIPRYRVMEALKSMQVQELKRELSLPRIFHLTEKRFLDKYVNNNPESSILLDLYYGGKAAKAIIDKETGSESVSSKEIHGSSEQQQVFSSAREHEGSTL